MIFLLLSVFNALLFLSQSSAEDPNPKQNTTLLFVQALFRHGERAPMVIYHNSPTTIEQWPGGLANLTPYGKRQHYKVGKHLRSMYKDFLTSNPKEVCVNSSSYDRCLRGAGVTAAALYEPEGIWKFEDDLNWQPIPVYYRTKDIDKHLSYHSRCPRGLDELEKLKKSEEIQEYYRKHQKALEQVSNYIEKNILEGFNVLFLQDALKIEQKYNFTWPTLLSNYFEEIQGLAEATFKAFIGSELILRLRIGPLLQEISENIKKKIRGDIPDLKIQLYFAHDIHVAAFLTALNLLNVTNVIRPPNLATLLIELHRMADSTTAVRLLYFNSTDPLVDMGKPHILVLDDCSEFCPVGNFTKKFQHLIPDDWEYECQLIASDDNSSVKILTVILGIITTFSFLSLFYVRFYGKRKVKKQEKKCLISRSMLRSRSKSAPGTRSSKRAPRRRF